MQFKSILAQTLIFFQEEGDIVGDYCECCPSPENNNKQRINPGNRRQDRNRIALSFG